MATKKTDMVLAAVLTALLAGGAAAYNTTAPAVFGHTIGEIDQSGTFCRASGSHCPNLKGKLSCTEVEGTAGAQESTATCASGYKATGGGCSWEWGHTHPSWFKSGNGWKCQATRTAGTGQVKAYAICCKVVKAF